MDEKLLIKSGLTSKQANMYIACLSLGAAKVPAIARRAKIKRSTAYGVLDELVVMGLVGVSIKGKVKIFRAQDPSRLVEQAEEKRRAALRALPTLRELTAISQLQPQVQFFEGRDGIRKIYDDVIECRSKKVQQMVRVREHHDFLGELSQEYIRRRVERGIVAYDLHPKSGDIYTAERGRESAKLKRFVRYLPNEVFYASMIMIYDSKVAMISTKKENFGFIIESQEFAGTLRAHFEYLWKLSSKDPG